MSQGPIETLSGSIRAGLSCACPRCGQGKLFEGFLQPKPRCEVCGLDYGFADAGDGPAVLWIPLIAIVTLGPLRPMKGLMIALQYHHRAEEGRFGGGDQP